MVDGYYKEAFKLNDYGNMTYSKERWRKEGKGEMGNGLLGHV